MPAPRNGFKFALKKLYDWLDTVKVNEKTQVVALTPITTANATDAATAMALANECKAKVNAIIAALKA